jgi:hypothetical protein
MPIAIGWLMVAGAYALIAWAGIRLSGYATAGAVNDISNAIERHIYVVVGLFAATVLVYKFI